MTVPGVNVIVAATFMAAVGDIRRFADRRKLTAYLGLDPRVRQSGAGPANHGHISKQGSNSARHALVEACWSTVRQPGPIAALLRALKAKRGHSIAIVASARKLACLFWCLLTRGEDYAFAQPSLTTKKMRRLELTAGAPRRQGGRDVWSTNTAMRTRRTRARAASPARLRTHRRRLASRSKGGRERDTGARITRPSKGQAARQTTSPDVCTSLRQSLAPTHDDRAGGPAPQADLTFIRRAKQQRATTVTAPKATADAEMCVRSASRTLIRRGSDQLRRTPDRRRSPHGSAHTRPSPES